MAIFVLQMKTFSRAAGSRGSRATSAAAYRAGERIRDERTGAVYDHRGRQDVLHKEILLPAALGSSPPGWTQQRSSLWNAAEQAEPRSNARVAREFMVVLPHELTAGGRLQLARGFALQIAERYGNAVDLVLHAPRQDPRNFHAHLLATTREVHATGLGAKTALEVNGTERHRRGLLRWSEERLWLRERWADLTNQTLEEASVEARVSAAYATQSADSPRLPRIAYYIEQRGAHSYVAARSRAAHHIENDRPIGLEQLRRDAIENWRAMRPGAEEPGQQQRESLRKWLEYRATAALAATAPSARARPEQRLEDERLQKGEAVRSGELDLGL